MKNRIAELRSVHGLTQQGLADEMGVSRQTVISLEKGRYNPSMPPSVPSNAHRIYWMRPPHGSTAAQTN